MAEKTIKTRLQMKNDSKENWDKATSFEPKLGEPIFYSDKNILKIGDDKRYVEDLPSLTTYSNDMPTVNALGGVAAGTIFEDMPITDVLTKILYPYIAPVIATATSTPNGGTFEKGDTQTVTQINTTVTKKSAAIAKVEVLSGSTVIATKTDVPNGGAISFTGLSETITTNKSFTVRVTDAEGGIVTKNTGSFNFVYPYYYGAIGVDTAISETVIKGFTPKVVSKGTKTWAITLNNQKAVFAYPKAYGTLKSIVDANNFTVTNAFTLSELVITGRDGSAQTYYVYVANGASSVSDFKFTFNI